MKCFAWLDTSGELLSDIFYRVEIPFAFPVDEDDYDEVFVCRNQWQGVILSVPRDCTTWEEALYGEVVAECNSRRCPINPEHWIYERTGEAWIDLHGGRVAYQFVFDLNRHVVVRSDFFDQLKHSGLVGITANPLAVGTNQTEVPVPDLVYLQFLGDDCTRQPIVEIPEPNCCPFCGVGPVICPECDHWFVECPACHRKIIIPIAEWEGPDDPRFVVGPCSLADGSPILEGHRWDGSDFIAWGHQGIVTGRVVDWILRERAGPFAAYPCRVDISRTNDEQLRRLQLAKGEIDFRIYHRL